ncbi:ABC transporter permease [Paracoccus sp. Z330]|uniref:ABC transporter permease n=1 Tax=Paracoccus onchidii TaxID=3017813 RepID=A0ABT4ZJ09_9RHOB|nr:ABC transporter permease [Paracoccus onchidii]MDB6179353.1 ABC transporter permease [Paracoccus onchidii]
MTLSDPSQAQLTITNRDGDLALGGALVVWTLPRTPPPGAQRIDLTDLQRMDTAGAHYLARQRAQGAELVGLSQSHRILLETVSDAIPAPDKPAPPRSWWHDICRNTGKRVVGSLSTFVQMTEYLGRFLAALLRALRHPSQFRLTSLVYHCQQTGLRAVSIVAVMSFLIGVVLAFQGAAQLRQFGAEVFVVDLIAISVLRELGILLTAIVVAGRTTSALTASIGSMKMREEIDAMRTLGMDPDMVLILPRVLALVLMLPILGLIADLSGLLGGAIMSWIELGVSPSMFMTRLGDISVDHAIVGLVKAPVFALIIGIIGCHAGMMVGKDAESLGSQTSASVVSAIFAIIIADAAFSILFSVLGI